MSENIPTPSDSIPPSSTASGQGAASQPPKRKRRHRILKVLGLLLILLILLVLFAPTLLSMGWVRNIVLGQVNKQLNGQLVIADWKFGWLSNIEIIGLKVVTSDGEVVRVGSVKTNMTVMRAAQMAFNGNFSGIVATITDPFAHIIVDEKGQINLAGLIKQADGSAPAPSPSPSIEPSKLPGLSNITIKVVNAKAEIEQTGMEKVVATVPEVELAIDEINKPIKTNLTARVAIGGRPEGTITVAGTVDAIENNLVDAGHISAEQKITWADLQLEAASPFLAGQLSRLKGVNSGSLMLEIKDGRKVTIAMSVDGQKIEVAPKALEGDAFVTSKLNITIPQSTVDLPGGLEDWQNALLHVGNEASPLSITFDQGKVTVFADAPLKAVLNAIKQAPGAEGQIGADVDIWLDKLALTMPKTIRLMEGWKLTEAHLTQKTRIDLKPQFLVVSQEAYLSKILATDPKGQAQTLPGGRLALSAASYGMSGAMPDLRDIVLNLDTIAGKIDVTAKNLATPEGKGLLELVKFNEYARVFDLPISIQGGVLALNFASTGQFLQAGDKVEPSGSFRLTNLAVTVKSPDGKEQWSFNEPLIDLSGSAAMVHGTTNLIEKITAGGFAIRVGDAAKLLVDVAGKLTGDAVFAPAIKVPFELTKGMIQLAELQKRYGKFMKPLEEMGLKFEQGGIDLSAAGRLDGNVIEISATVKQTDIRMVKAGSPQPIVNNFNSQADFVVTVDMAKGIRATISKLAVLQQNNKYSIRLPDNAGLVVDMPEKGPISIKGPLAIDADLQWIGDRASLFAGRMPRSQPGDVQSGTLAVAVDFSGDGISPKGTLKLAGVSVRTPDNQASKGEDLAVVFDVAIAGDFASANVRKLVLKGLVDATIADTSVKLGSSVWEMVPQANVQVAVADIKPLLDLLSAFMPKGTDIVAATPAGQPTADPFEISDIQGGSLDLQLAVSQQQDQTVVNITKLTMNDIAIKNGKAPKYVLPPVNLNLNAVVVGKADPAKPSQPIMEQIKSITINRLGGSAGIAELSMPEKIVLTDLAGKPKAAGSVELKGSIIRVIELTNAFQGLPASDALAATGDFLIRQKLSTAGDAVSAGGNITFTSLDIRKNNSILFREERVTIDNNLTYDIARHDAAGTIKLDMASSKTLSLDFTGAVDDLMKRRAIRDKVNLAVRGDYPKLLELAKVFMSPDQVKTLNDVKLGGPLNETYTVTGSFPADKPFNEAIKFLNVTGGIGIDSFEATGATGQKFGLNIKLVNGLLTTANRQGNETAIVNGGGLNLAGIQVDLTGPEPLVSTPDNLHVVRDVKTTPVLLKALDVVSILDPQHPAMLNVKVVSCQKLPLGDMIGEKNAGQLKVTYRLDDVQLGGGVFDALRAVDVLGSNSSDLRGQLTGEATIANGFFTIPNLTLATGAKDRPLFTLAGKGALDEVGKLDFKASLVTTYIKAVQKQKELAKWMPDYVSFGITGPRAAPKVDAGKIVSGLVTEAIKKKALGQFLPQPTEEPTPKDGPKPKDPKPKKTNPLEEILKGIPK